jgi:amino acid permease
VLVPPFDSALRVSSTWSATVNLLTTIVGGGILSLPFTFKACGLVVGLSTLVASGVASGLTMGWLIECARLTGANDFSAVAARAFASSGAAGGGGAAAELVVTLVVLTICVFTLLADSILIADTSSALLTAAIGPPADDDGGGTARRRDAALGVLLVLVVLPLSLQRSLHALRHAGLAGFLSACFLGLVLVVRAAQRILSSSAGPFTSSPHTSTTTSTTAAVATPATRRSRRSRCCRRRGATRSRTRRYWLCALCATLM